jgi:hypothetical protein
MSGNSLFALLFVLAFAFAPITGARAADPMPGIDIAIRMNPSGLVLVQATTNAKGEFVLRSLSAGKYWVELGGKYFEAAKAKDPGGTWIITLVAAKAPASAQPDTYSLKAAANGVLRADLVVPDGHVVTFRGTLAR